jgi:putative ABC transport system permease protein
MKLNELIEISLKNVLSQGLKSSLTILGVIIGIAAIIALVSLGQGLTAVVEEQFELMGMNSIFVEPGSPETMLAGGMDTLRSSDVKIIESIPGVDKVIPFYEGAVIIKSKQEETEAVFIGVNANQIEYLKQMGYLDLEEGRNLRQGDKYSIVIYNNLAKEIFEKELKLRESLELNGHKFRIVGISKTPAMIGLTGMTAVLITEQAAKEIFKAKDPIEIAVLVTSKELVPKISEEIEKKLEKAHGEKNFYLMTSDQMLDSANIVLGLLQIFLLGLASISLLVGGIGIMNTMLMTVIERTNEIGLMKAIGATKTQILTQFITEAAIIGLIGGTIGTIIGLGFAVIVSIISENAGMPLKINISIELIFGAMLFAIIVGIISGFIPAQRAANLDPVDALRYE